LIFYTTDAIEGLTEDTQYYFKALARNKIGVGPYSDVVSYRTEKKIGQPSESKNAHIKHTKFFRIFYQVKKGNFGNKSNLTEE